MFKRVAPYIGEYKKYTVLAVIFMVLGIIASVSPYFFVYQNRLFNSSSVNNETMVLPSAVRRY